MKTKEKMDDIPNQTVMVKLTMQVVPEKRKELLQTLWEMIELTRKEQGCISHGAYRNLEDENNFILLEEWQSREYLQSRFQTDQFSALLGALTLLGKGYEFNVIVGPPLEIFAGGGHELILKAGEQDG